MPGLLIHVRTRVTCPHAGVGLASAPNPRVRVDGLPTVQVVVPYDISGCPVPPVGPGSNGPCITGAWLGGTTRVRSNRQPLVVSDSPSICAPNGGSMIVTGPLSRVVAA